MVVRKKQKQVGHHRLVCGTPAPKDCELYYVDKDALFSYHTLSEVRSTLKACRRRNDCIDGLWWYDTHSRGILQEAQYTNIDNSRCCTSSSP